MMNLITTAILLEVQPVNNFNFLGIESMSPLEQLLLAAGTVVFFSGALSMLSLSKRLMDLQKIRLLEKYRPELLEESGINLPKEVTESWWSRVYKKLIDTVPLEKEADILLDHDYDGVMELDNNLPPWWKALFYISIAIAPIYIYINHLSDYAISSHQAYDAEMDVAALAVKEYLKTQSDLVDESNVVALTDEVAILAGKTIFDNKCVACHGAQGEGGIGPNLTDKYWLHGGSVNDIFKTIKYGVPEMGMIAWKSELRPSNMQEVSSYILSLAGSNPPNPKAPQGELYKASPAEDPATKDADAIPNASK